MNAKKIFDERKEIKLEAAHFKEADYCLVTGASQGLGKAFAENLARNGENLILTALPDSGMPQTAAELARRYGIQVEFFEIDLTHPDGPETLCRQVVERGLPVSTLINNAGGGYNSRFDESTLGQNETCILLNNLALVKVSRLMLPELKKHTHAYILNVASLAAFFPMPFMPVYSPSKAFTLNFSLALREEMRYTPVSVSVLCPNGIRTNQECIEKIESGGLAARLTCMEADDVARYALNKMYAGKDVIVPGWLNQVVVAVSKYTPRAIVNRVVAAFWGRTARPGNAAGSLQELR